MCYTAILVELSVKPTPVVKITDYELVIINTIKNNFPLAEHSDSLFLFTTID